MNGQVEHANGMVLQGLKPRIYNRLKKFAGHWVVELLTVLWSLRTTPSRATGFTPFFMVYGAEAILPTDLEYGSPIVKAYSKQGLDAAMEDALDQLDEARDVACYGQQNTNRHYDATIIIVSEDAPLTSET